MIGCGSTVTRAEALSVLEEYLNAVEQLLKDGFSINTPIFNLSPSVKRIFYVADQSFNSASHSVKINISAGLRLREISLQVSVERVKGSSPKPDIEYLDDLSSDTGTEQLTSGNNARIQGDHLKFEATDPEQGIYLIVADGTETKVIVVSHKKLTRFDFLVPALNPGEYKIEVRAVIYKGKENKKRRITRYVDSC
jgi:hypothetical protein